MTDSNQIKISVMKIIALAVACLLFSIAPAVAESEVLSPKAEKTAYEIGDIILSNNLVTEDISSTSELDLSLIHI